MKHHRLNGVCENCGSVASADGECSAEVTLAELMAMRDGTATRRSVKATAAQLQALSQSPSIRANCQHRGAELRQVECTGCCGSVRLKVFSCVIHHECTLATRSEGLARCQACSDFTATQSTDSATIH